MYNVRTNWACVHIKIKTVCSRALGFILKTPSDSERSVQKFEKINYMNKYPSQIRLFKNKFAFARNTQKFRQFAKS